MSVLTTEQSIGIIKRSVVKKGYQFFESGQFNLNIVGIRSTTRDANAFDDVLTLSYMNEHNYWKFHSWPITTDPGNKSLIETDSKGTAILVPNQYKGVWMLDLHHNDYLALCQRLGNVSVWRDANKNTKLDTGGTIDTGMFGINIHRSSPDHRSVAVENWSAGCQVFADPNHFAEFITICVVMKNIYGNKFTYTLLDEIDIVY